MSSIFSFDPEPPKVLSSPWPAAHHFAPLSTPTGSSRVIAGLETGPEVLLTDYGVDKLAPEPQEGPLEYKLHLLLRPRRKFSALSTGQYISGSHLSKSRVPRSDSAKGSPLLLPNTSAAAPASSGHSRQSRLQHLTTQLLWRLQQSSPHHLSSKTNLVVPILPNTADHVLESAGPSSILPGLEESKGALYEIGVSDDGSFVGLTRDELEESLRNLLAMASSLGCKVEIVRTVVVGDCQWHEVQPSSDGLGVERLRKEKLWVVEVLIVPNLAFRMSEVARNEPFMKAVEGENNQAEPNPHGAKTSSQVEQLRVSLTGSTTSGKSTLLGTLATSTLDNGRGKSRLSLLKHPHEIASGVTSSVTSSLIGYQDVLLGDNRSIGHTDVINYASGNISSWTDIHAASGPGRLVFLNDSAGHPRYRRTTVRGLVSWAPHWTVCCIAADNDENTSGRSGATASAVDVLGSSCASLDLSEAHLNLCLKLELPLVVVITKLDLASKNGLKVTLSKILSSLKSAGRQPILASTPPGEEQQELHLQSISQMDRKRTQNMLSPKSARDIRRIVPIVFTSAVTGAGVIQVHSLLRQLPIFQESNFPQQLRSMHVTEHLPKKTFHVDEVFVPSNPHKTVAQDEMSAMPSSIISGHLSYGTMSVGEEVLIGPFNPDTTEQDGDSHEVRRSGSYPKIKGSWKPDAFARRMPRPSSGDFSATKIVGSRSSSAIWRRSSVASVRNLRLPVQQLLAGQAGTLGFTTVEGGHESSIPSLSKNDRLRKGMVVLSVPSDVNAALPRTYFGFTAVFAGPVLPSMPPGTLVNVYIASIRALANILQIKSMHEETSLAKDIFDLDDVDSDGGQCSSNPEQTEVTFHYVNSVEWFEVGSQVLVMPASGYSSSNRTVGKTTQPMIGLEGLVGRVTQALA